jgi:succinyl-CoA:acetate CoA-transferase
MERLSFMYQDRIRCSALRGKITSAAEAALLIKDGMRVGASGFTRAGDAKAVPVALAERVRQEGKPLQITLMTGASLGHDVDRMLRSTRPCVMRSIAVK